MAILQEAVDDSGLTQEKIAEFKEELDNDPNVRPKVHTSAKFAAAVAFALNMQVFRNGQPVAIIQTYGWGKGFTDKLRFFAEHYVDPMITYVHDQLDEENSTLYLLEKYKRRTEWFLAGSLLGKYRSVATNFEKVFEDDLRMYLFDQGIEYPFSTPQTSSGRTDIVGLIDTKNPLVLEIKIYDKDKQYRKNRVISGFSQIVKYTNDYNKHVGYLVVFNVDPVEIEIVQNGVKPQFPCRIEFNSKVYYVIFVNLNFETSASKTGKLTVESITREELFAGASALESEEAEA